MTKAPESSESIEQRRLVRARIDAERDHLLRLGIWSATSIVGGAGLWASAEAADLEPVRGFGQQAIAWGAINGGISALGLWSSTNASDALTRDEALDAEDTLAKVLWVNVGLDAGYMMAGATLIAASFAGVDEPVAFRSHGAGIITQGLGLLVLDVIAVWSSWPRERALAALPTEPTAPTDDGGQARAGVQPPP